MDRPLNVTPDYARLVDAVTGDREGFVELYDTLAEAAGAATYLMLEFGLSDGEQVDPMRLAFQQAHEGGWLSKLLGALRQHRRLRWGAAQVQFSGEAVLKPSAGMSLVGTSREGLVDAGLRVCLVKVDANGKQSCGTGFLIGPQTVLTNHHVVKPLLEEPNHTTRRPGSAANLKILFDYLEHGRPGKQVNVAEDWLVACSGPHALESDGKVFSDITDDLEGFRTCLDFAVIRLDHAVGRERGYYELARCAPPVEKMSLIVVQHPHASPMLVTDGKAGAPWPASIGTRLPHDANTMVGSSGGLVVDEAYRPIALHQGCHHQNGKPVTNVAIPTHHIAALRLPLSSIEGLDPIWRIDATQAPVFGRLRLQELLNAAAQGPIRVIKVLGSPRSGISFSADIARQYAMQWRDVAVRVSSDELTAGVRELGIRWLAAAGAGPDVTSQLPIQHEANTAFSAWMRDDFVPTFMGLLEQALANRRFWLIVDNLATRGLSADDAGLLVLHLLERAPTHSLVRLVLLGGGDTGAVPTEALGTENIQSVTRADIQATAAKHLVALTGTAGFNQAHAMATSLHAVCRGDVEMLAEHFPSILRDMVSPKEA